MVGCALLLGSVLLISLGCPKTPDRIPPAAINSNAGQDAIAAYDTNKDGKISGDELFKCPAIKAALAQIDPSGKGEVTADMINARIQSWKNTKLARMNASCVVKRNGKPFAGATVRFVPEKFLGEAVKEGVGKTDKYGIATLAIPNLSPPGMGLGLYRVVITKEGTKIPDQYSKEETTILGQEIARDAAGMKDMSGIKFDLKF
jgi:hypothetical protein